jgi:hypothetical protein
MAILPPPTDHHRDRDGCLMNIEPNILFTVHEGAPFVGDDACAHNLLLKRRPFIMRFRQSATCATSNHVGATIGLVTIELTRKHALVFAVLFATQTVGLWVTFSWSPVLAGLPRSIWVVVFGMLPGSAFLTTVILMELLRGVLPKNR